MAQQPPADEGLAAFRAELKGRVILQAFSADPVTNFEWTNGGLTVTPPNVRTFGVYSFKSVNLHKDSVELTGSRSTYLRGKDGKPELLAPHPRPSKSH